MREDKQAAEIAQKADNHRKEFQDWLAQEAYKRKKGVNRRTAYWSAM